MSLTFSILEREDQPVLSIQTRTSMNELPDTILQALMKVGQYLERLKIEPSGPAYVAYFNLDMLDSKVEIGFPIAKTVAGEGEIAARVIPGGLVGLCDYIGPYQDLASVYQQLNTYLEGQGREPTGVSYEFYLNDPAVTPPEELHTQVVFPLEGAAVWERERTSGNGRSHSLYW